MNPIIRNVEDLTWVFGFVFGIGVLLILIKFAFYKSFASLGNLQEFRNIEENSLPLALIIHIGIGVLMGIILYPFVQIPFLFINQLWISILFLIITAILFVNFKFLFNLFIIKLTHERDVYKKILRSKVYYKIYTLITLLFGALFIYFAPIDKYYSFYGLLFIYTIILIIDFYNLLNNGKVYALIKSYYFILYLCILGILPILYIYLHWYK